MSRSSRQSVDDPERRHAETTANSRFRVFHATAPVAAAETHDLTVRGVELDAEGIVPEALDCTARETAARGLYMMPTLQNPTTGTQSEARRRELLEVARAHDLQVLEDDTYIDLISSSPPCRREDQTCQLEKP